MKKIFLSYNWNSKELANKIESRLKGLGIFVTRDVHTLNTGDSLQSFMKTLQSHDHVLCIISDDYLKSLACMYEQILIAEAIKNTKKDRFILPLIQSGTLIFSTQDRVHIKAHWIKQKEEIESSLPKEISQDPDLEFIKNILGSTDTIIDGILESVARIPDTLSLLEKDLLNNESQFFHSLFIAMKEPYPVVYDLLFEAELITDREQRLLRFDELRSQFQDQLLITLFEAYMHVHDVQDNIPAYKLAEKCFKDVLTIKPDYCEPMINFSSLYADYPENFPNAYDKALSLAMTAMEHAQNSLQSSLAKFNAALIYHRLWEKDRHLTFLFDANKYFREAIQDNPNNAKIHFSYYAFLHDNLYKYPNLATLEEMHQNLNIVLSQDPEFIISECERGLSQENPNNPHPFLRKIGSKAATILNDWELKKKYCDEIIQTTAQCVPQNPDHAHSRDAYRAEALAGKAHATLKLGKNSISSNQAAIDLLSEARLLFEKIGETQAAMNVKLNLLNLEKMKISKSL